MTTDTSNEPITVSAVIPPTAVDDALVVRSLLEHHADELGLTLHGEPTLHKLEPACVEVDGQRVYPFGDTTPIYRAECLAVPKEKVEPMVLAPTEQAVVEGAKALHARMSQHVGEWDDLPAHVRNWYAQTALDVLNAALPKVSQTRQS